MSAMAHEPRQQDHEDVLLEGFLALETPEGFRAELIEGEIVVTPPPDGDHEDHISLIAEQVFMRSETRMQFSGNKGLKVPRGRLRLSPPGIMVITADEPAGRSRRGPSGPAEERPGSTWQGGG